MEEMQQVDKYKIQTDWRNQMYVCMDTKQQETTIAKNKGIIIHVYTMRRSAYSKYISKQYVLEDTLTGHPSTLCRTHSIKPIYVTNNIGVLSLIWGGRH